MTGSEAFTVRTSMVEGWFGAFFLKISQPDNFKDKLSVPLVTAVSSSPLSVSSKAIWQNVPTYKNCLHFHEDVNK